MDNTILKLIDILEQTLLTMQETSRHQHETDMKIMQCLSDMLDRIEALEKAEYKRRLTIDG